MPYGPVYTVLAKRVMLDSSSSARLAAGPKEGEATYLAAYVAVGGHKYINDCATACNTKTITHCT